MNMFIANTVGIKSPKGERLYTSFYLLIPLVDTNSHVNTQRQLNNIEYGLELYSIIDFKIHMKYE